MQRIRDIFFTVIGWIGRHKIIVFVVIPLVAASLMALYVSVIYFQWKDERNDRLSVLTKYKELIDRTEELRKGMEYQYSDVDLTAKAVDIPTRIYDRKNQVIGEFFEQKREIVPFETIPPALVKAVIASEDRDFYKHRGVNYRGIFRAMLVNIIHFRVVQGGSTISQQLGKCLFKMPERTLKRKIYEVFLAWEIEKKYDKQDILAMYLNFIYFGNSLNGVESTAKMFFGTSVSKLDEAECAMIVATISNPLIYSPLHNIDNSVKKTQRILKSMVDAGYLDQGRADQLYKRFLKKWECRYDRSGRVTASLIGRFATGIYRGNRAIFFNKMIFEILKGKFGEDVLIRGGLSVFTTLDAEVQEIAERELKRAVQDQRAYHQKNAGKAKQTQQSMQEIAKAENIEGGLVTLDPHTGEIIAYVGGSEFSARNQVDHVSQIQRQPGSSFKPLVYTAAIEAKDITPATVFKDERTQFKGKYKPQNYDGVYRGDMIAREALKRSVNIVAVKVLEKTGFDRILEILGKVLGLSGSDLKHRFGSTLSLALGAYEVSPLENCLVNAVIVNGGDYIEPYGIRFVKDYNDTMVWNNEEEVRRRTDERRKDMGKIIDPRACAVTVSMLRGVFEKDGTAYFAAKGMKIPFAIAGKTGTSSKYIDAWFVGYTSNSVTAIWIGNKSGGVSLGAGRAGGAIAAPLWTRFIAEAYSANPPADFPVPEGVSREAICMDTGMVAGRNGECPHVAMDQLFYAGSEPGEYCTKHVRKEKPIEQEIGEPEHENREVEPDALKGE